MLPKFSLDRGYEFRHSVDRLERQCFLQSVLIAGLMQRMGMEAGVVMIYRNQKGEASNLGHATVVLKLDNGRDIMVDASDPHPFMRHRGVFAAHRLPGPAQRPEDRERQPGNDDRLRVPRPRL